jgi:hypothetical protein
MPRCLIITNRWLARIEFSAFLASGTPEAPDAHNGKLSKFLGRLAPGGEKCPRRFGQSVVSYASAGTPAPAYASSVCVLNRRASLTPLAIYLAKVRPSKTIVRAKAWGEAISSAYQRPRRSVRQRGCRVVEFLEPSYTTFDLPKGAPWPMMTPVQTLLTTPTRQHGMTIERLVA